MTTETSVYNLEYFDRGSYYSAGSDYRRFVTLDYNMESYVGVVGVGIIDGWTVQQTEGLNVEVLPGIGIISGYFAESPYTIKQRSEMVAGDREIYALADDDTSEPDLTTSQRATYVAVVQLYDPTFDPVGAIENAYVKVVVPTELSLSNNADNYIYVERPSGATPYPLLNDLSVLIAALPSEPVRSDYDDYDDYNTARTAYNAALDNIYDYKFYTSSDNHFTEVDFKVSTSFVATSSKVLLAKVMTRANDIYDIDTSGINSLKNLQSEVQSFAYQYIRKHIHGGDKSYDPPKIRLETDIRNCVLKGYNEDNGFATYSVMETTETSTELGHKHTYKIDVDGNGNTIEQIGSTNKHFHQISDSIVGEPEGTSLVVDSHTHTILEDLETSSEDNFIWEDDDQYIVYVNNESFGDETSSYVTADASKKQITFNAGISVSQRTYSCSFPMFDGIYTFTDKAPTVLKFMTSMMLDFRITYRDKFDYARTLQFERLTSVASGGGQGAVLTGVIDSINAYRLMSKDGPFQNLRDEIITDDIKATLDPFYFFIDDDLTETASMDDFINQCEVAQTLMENPGDQFVFTPNAAYFITITLEEVFGVKGNVDDVKIEILGNSEVTGTLKTENILYINADKITTGEFDVSIIPFVSHVGRLEEECFPFQYPLVSNDGARYEVVPGVTDVSLDHYHNLILDRSGDGASQDTLINDVAVHYGEGTNGDLYFIAHAHSVEDEIMQDTETEGLTEWQSDLAGTNVSSSHTHDIIKSVRGDNKVVYSIKEDINGHLYAGTSDGLRMIPSGDAYKYVLNDYGIYLHGSDLWQLLLNAKEKYEEATGKPFVVTSAIYSDEITNAAAILVNDGVTVKIEGYNDPERGQDILVIQKISNFKLPKFRYTAQRKEAEILENEEIIGEVLSSNVAGEITTQEFLVERDFSDVPIWSIELKTVTEPSEAYISSVSYTDLIAVGSNVITKNKNLANDVNTDWTNIEYPLFVGINRKIIKATSGDFWVVTNNGILVSRTYSEGTIFNAINFIPEGNPNIKDIVEGRNNYIYVASSSGIFLTTDAGKEWSKLLDVRNGFNQIVRDYTLDKSNVVNGHYHLVNVDYEGNGFLEESIGTGTPHVHTVSWWDIAETLGHTHNLVVTLFAVTNDKAIWKSIDNGTTWTAYCDLPDGECGDLIAVFDRLFVSKGDGLYRYNPTPDSWKVMLDKKIYCNTLDYDMTGLLLGSDNSIYRTFNGSDYTLIHTFEGEPSPILLKNGIRKDFGYGYSNESETYHFKDLLVSSDSYNALIDFNNWYAAEGSWNSDALYDVYVEYKRILSTKYDEDKRDSTGYNFTVSSSNGLLDFGSTTNLTETIDVYDQIITVQDSTGFYVGDRIFIESLSSFTGELPKESDYRIEVTAEDQELINSLSGETYTQQYDVDAYQKALNAYYVELDLYRNMYMFNTISAVNNNEITLSTRSTNKIEAPANIYKIPSLNGDSSVILNIYESLLSSIGNFTHDEVEDKLSNFSDGRPYKFNDTYLSNLLQLTQALRYVYPDINTYFKNDVFYDFKYQSVLNPTFPDIDDYIDVTTSEIYNQQLYADSYMTSFAKSINKILIGYGTFADKIFVATDIGVFWAVLTDAVEANWFYVGELGVTVNDLIIFNDKLLAATDNGTYSTTDVVTWTLEASPAISYPSHSFSLRWEDYDVVSVGAHDAYFNYYDPAQTSSSESSEEDNVRTIAYITAVTGTPYSVLSEDRGIKIANAGDKNGYYIIKQITDGGNGWGSQIIVSPCFEGTAGLKINITMTMGQWWKQWNDDDNIANANITNTLMVGGKDNISFNNDQAVWQWQGSSFIYGIQNFVIKNFLPLSVGNMLSSAITYDTANKNNYLFKSNDIGQTWDVFREFEEVKGEILTSTVSDENNTLFTVSFTSPENYTYQDGSLALKAITVLDANSATIGYSNVIWNQINSDSENIITIFDNDIDTVIGDGSGYSFVVRPLRVNDMMETPERTLLFGTDEGTYYDVNSVVNNLKPQGTILSVGINGTVDRIDVKGEIVSINTNTSTSNSVLSVTSIDTTIRASEFVGKYLYVTDANPVEKYKIVRNTSVSGEGEATIEIEATLTQEYVGKRFTVVGDKSRLYINFDLPVFKDQFNNGTLYVASNENDNLGKTYEIDNNSETYIDIKEVIVPSSTLISVVTSETTSEEPIKAGQDIRLVDSSGRLTLWVSMDRTVKDNSLEGLNFRLLISSSDAVNKDDIIIHSNTKNSITIDSFTIGDVPDVFLFERGDSYEVDGVLFEKLPGFNNKLTSTNSDHYHALDLLNVVVSGDIDSFGTTDGSYVTFTVSNTVNFNNPIIQTSWDTDIFKDAKIVFTNTDSYNLRFVSDVVSHTDTTLTVRLKSSSYWDFDAYSELKISEGWQWEVDMSNYGYTDGITYDDFVVLNTKITSDADRGTNEINVEDTTGMVVGDKIRIQDQSLSSEIKIISEVTSLFKIKTTTNLDRTFYEKNNSEIKVLRDTFSNTHIHQVRNSEVENISVSSYLDNGYPAEHSHRVLPLLSEVSVLLNRSTELIALGSDSKIYKSINNGDSWVELVDLNDWLEDSIEVDGVSTAILNNANDLVVGATNGFLYVEGIIGGTVVPIVQP